MPLVNLKNLSSVVAADTQVSDLTPLADLKKLDYLSISDTKISDLTPLVNLKNLRFLYVSFMIRILSYLFCYFC